MDKLKAKTLSNRLLECQKSEQEKMLFMWIKQEVISLGEYREILKNIKSSSRIIHSQPELGCFYWVKLFDDREYEVARPKLRNEELWFCFTNGSHKKVSEVSDWKKKPIIFNEADYG